LIRKIQSDLACYLPDKRLAHVRRVADTAVDLARHWGVDPEKAAIAAWTHDCAKPLSPTKLQELGIPQPAWSEHVFTVYTPVWHALIGPYVAKHKWQISNRDIAGAIASHTTGKPHMTPLAMIVFVSDFIEPGRTFEAQNRLTTLAYTNLSYAAYAVCLSKLDYLIHHHARVHPFALDCYHYFIETLPAKARDEIGLVLWPDASPCSLG
jgi:predicted HD superfamily hydrolase involved in NAD metabolism